MEFGFGPSVTDFSGGAFTNSLQDGYSPGRLLADDVQSTVPKGYSVESALDKSWQQLEVKLLQQFWEHGFGLRIFGTDTGATSSGDFPRVLGLHRPLGPAENHDAEIAGDVSVGVSGQSKRLKHPHTWMGCLTARCNPGLNNGTVFGRLQSEDGTVAGCLGTVKMPL